MKSIPHNGQYKNKLKEAIIMPCTKITTEDVWVKTFPMLTTETAIRLNDVNSDGYEDVIIGFGTGKFLELLKYYFIVNFLILHVLAHLSKKLNPFVYSIVDW